MPATMLSPGFVKPCKTMQKVDDWRELASVMAHYRLPLEGVATFEELKEKTNAWETLLPTFCHNRGTEDFLDFAATIDAFLGAWQCWDQGTQQFKNGMGKIVGKKLKPKRSNRNPRVPRQLTRLDCSNQTQSTSRRVSLLMAILNGEAQLGRRVLISELIAMIASNSE